MLGLALGSSLSRSVSLGFYLIGAFLLVSGFFVATAAPRGSGQGDEGLWGFGRRKRACAGHGGGAGGAVSTTAIFVAARFVLLILIGVIADTRYSLF